MKRFLRWKYRSIIQRTCQVWGSRSWWKKNYIVKDIPSINFIIKIIPKCLQMSNLINENILAITDYDTLRWFEVYPQTLLTYLCLLLRMEEHGSPTSIPHPTLSWKILSSYYDLIYLLWLAFSTGWDCWLHFQPFSFTPTWEWK